MQADFSNHLLRRVVIAAPPSPTPAPSPTATPSSTTSEWIVMTLAGNTSGVAGSSNCGLLDGAGTMASFRHAYGVAVNSAGTLAVVVSRWYWSRCMYRSPPFHLNASLRPVMTGGLR